MDAPLETDDNEGAGARPTVYSRPAHSPQPRGCCSLGLHRDECALVALGLHMSSSIRADYVLLGQWGQTLPPRHMDPFSSLHWVGRK